MNKRAVGNKYETLACKCLEKNGLKIIERNYRRRIGEIDIIAKDKEYIVFAEVKFRKNTDYGGSAFAINHSKQQTIIRVAEWYMKEKHIPPLTPCRFDAVLVDGRNVTYVKDAWR